MNLKLPATISDQSAMKAKEKPMGNPTGRPEENFKTAIKLFIGQK
jgi:hypothetical protein